MPGILSSSTSSFHCEAHHRVYVTKRKILRVTRRRRYPFIKTSPSSGIITSFEIFFPYAFGHAFLIRSNNYSKMRKYITRGCCSYLFERKTRLLGFQACNERKKFIVNSIVRTRREKLIPLCTPKSWEFNNVHLTRAHL